MSELAQASVVFSAVALSRVAFKRSFLWAQFFILTELASQYSMVEEKVCLIVCNAAMLTRVNLRGTEGGQHLSIGMKDEVSGSSSRGLSMQRTWTIVLTSPSRLADCRP